MLFIDTSHASLSLPSSTENPCSLLCLDVQHEKLLQTKIFKIGHKEYRDTNRARSRQKGMGYLLPVRVKLLILSVQRGPLLLPAPQQFCKLLTSGDLYCSYCFGVFPDVCLNRLSSLLFRGLHTFNAQKAIIIGFKRESSLLLRLFHLRMRYSGFVQPHTSLR